MGVPENAISGRRCGQNLPPWAGRQAIWLGKRARFWDGFTVQRQNQITMSVWEYKVISSGKGGFATPALLEKFLGELGRDEWEIIHYQSPPDNPLAFSGLARRSTQRDWTLEDAAAAAARAEAEKLRAEFEAKFKAATSTPPAAEEKPASFLEEKAAPDDGFRKPVDTSHDDDPDAPEEEKDEWDKLTAAEEDELPTFFDAIKPHLRRNQRGPGMSVGVDYLAKKWDQSEDDLKGALIECGFAMPEDEDAAPVYLEYDGDLYWLNINRRGELWINTKEKPRPVFRAVKGQRVTVEEPAKPEGGSPKVDVAEAPTTPSTEAAAAPPSAEKRDPKPAAAPGVLPAGPELLAKIKPHMRRNRRGPGGSGSASFLSRALKCSESDLTAAFAALGLVVPAKPEDKPVLVEVDGDLWWLNQDSRGGLWINGREKKPGETVASAKEPELSPVSAGESAPVPAPAVAAVEPVLAPAPAAPVAAAPAGEAAPASPLAALRLILKETRTGSVAGRVDRLAETIGQPPEQLVATLTSAGLKVPEKPREKPVFIEHAGEIFWLNKNAKDELWLNAKASKFAEKGGAAADGGGHRQRRGRASKKEA